MKLTITKQTAEEIEIPIPSFYRSTDGNEYRAILSETDFREVWQNDISIFIKMTGTDIAAIAISAAVQTFEKISEIDFFTKWDDALNQLSLTPKLKP